MTRWFSSLLVFGSLLLAGCQFTNAVVTEPNYSLKSYSALPPINIDVKDIQLVEVYTPTYTAPYVEHRFPILPVDAFKAWMNDRIQTSGKDGTLRIIIKNAKVKETELPPSQKGLKGLFTIEQSERYDAELEVVFEIYKDDIMPAAEIQIAPTRSQTISENRTLIERNLMYHQLTVDLVDQFNQEMESYVQQYFSDFLLTEVGSSQRPEPIVN